MSNLSKRILALLLSCCFAAPLHAGGLVEITFQLADFSTPLTIDNPWWPLAPGRRIVYFEVGDECVVNDFVVTRGSKQDFQGAYAGLSARAVRDREWLDEDCDGGRDVLLEDTFDWYAQDNAGNVWYFGEDTTEFLYDDEGNPIGSSKLGSWEAGIDGAVAGLIMLAHPAKGAFYRQEFYEDVAEDAAKVVAVNVPVSIGLGDFSGCLVTKEWSPLDPGAVEHKHYCPNVGLVLIEKLGGKTEVVEAIDLGLP
ncbi:MAG TPA: hypothetical protein VGD21_10430 [Lysobacter sp.]